MMTSPLIQSGDVRKDDRLPTCLIFFSPNGKCFSPRVTEAEQRDLDTILESLLRRPDLQLVPLPQANINLEEEENQ